MPGEPPTLRMYMPAKIRWVMSRPSRYKVLDGGRIGFSYTDYENSIENKLDFECKFVLI